MRSDSSIRSGSSLGLYSIDQDSFVLEYAGSTQRAFRAKGCQSGNNAVDPGDACWEFYFRIPDTYPSGPFNVVVQRLGVTPTLEHNVLVVPKVAFQFLIDTRPPGGALTAAAQKGDLSEVKRLIAAGSNIYEASNRVDQTPMLHAAVRGHIDVMKVLLEAGYDVNWQPKILASSLLNEAMSNNAPNAALVLLLERGANANVLKCDNTCTSTIHMALGRNRNELIALLVSKGGDINRVTDSGSPLWAAYSWGSPESTVEKLASLGAVMLPPSINCPEKTTQNWDATHERWARWCERQTSAAAVKHGSYIEWHPNTKFKVLGEYRDGLPHGSWGHRDHAGKDLVTEYFDAGRLSGKLYFRETGKFLKSEWFDNSGSITRIVYFEGDNKPAREVRFENGKEVSQ